MKKAPAGREFLSTPDTDSSHGRIGDEFPSAESTLVMLVSAFAGREHILNAYNTAVQERYRFFSFGDAMLIQ